MPAAATAFTSARSAREIGFDAHGVDISAYAADAAARRYPPGPRCEWIVANADRFVPYADASFSIVLSITARMHAGEFRRVLRDGGRLLVALASPEDLAELRSHLGEAGRDRAARTIETFAQAFTLAGQRRVTTTAELDAEAVRDVLRLDLPAAEIAAGRGDARHVQSGSAAVSAALFSRISKPLALTRAVQKGFLNRDRQGAAYEAGTWTPPQSLS